MLELRYLMYVYSKDILYKLYKALCLCQDSWHFSLIIRF